MRSIGAGWMRSRPLRFLAIAIIGLMLGAGGCSQLVEKERELTFRVVPGNASWYGGLPAGVEELDIPLHGAGQHINAWWWPSESAHAPAVLYFHGSRWNLTGQLTRISQLHEFGFSVLAIDYRGFGKSAGGVPSEESVYEDARVAWNRFTELVPEANRRFIYGHSLGGAVAIDLASRKHARVDYAALAVESTFSSLVDLAASAVGPLGPIAVWLSGERFDSFATIAKVDAPILMLHGERDDTVPVALGRKLRDAAPPGVHWIEVPGGSHSRLHEDAPTAYRAAFESLIASLCSPR